LTYYLKAGSVEKRFVLIERSGDGVVVGVNEKLSFERDVLLDAHNAGSSEGGSTSAEITKAIGVGKVE
jgi:hypothetical protein